MIRYCFKSDINTLDINTSHIRSASPHKGDDQTLVSAKQASVRKQVCFNILFRFRIMNLILPSHPHWDVNNGNLMMVAFIILQAIPSSGAPTLASLPDTYCSTYAYVSSTIIPVLLILNHEYEMRSCA